MYTTELQLSLSVQCMSSGQSRLLGACGAEVQITAPIGVVQGRDSMDLKGQSRPDRSVMTVAALIEATAG